MVFLLLEQALEVKSTTIASPLADQTTSRIVAELGMNVCLRRGLNCYREDVKRNRGNSLALQTQSSLTLIHFYLIGYWRLKGNATSSTLCQHREQVKHHSKIYKISKWNVAGSIGMRGIVLYWASCFPLDSWAIFINLTYSRAQHMNFFDCCYPKVGKK